jgi:hypothetical protein
VTTTADIQLVKNMMKGNMDNPRSFMLAVVPVSIDFATQETLELAAEAEGQLIFCYARAWKGSWGLRG